MALTDRLNTYYKLSLLSLFYAKYLRAPAESKAPQPSIKKSPIMGLEISVLSPRAKSAIRRPVMRPPKIVRLTINDV